MFNNREKYSFTSEAVSEGHPDKVADQISDAVLDLYLAQDPEARVAVETLCTTDYVLISGEVRGPLISRHVIEDTIRFAVEDIGYDQEGFHHANMKVDIKLHEQSKDIAQGVDAEGAGDQGIMFGYATTETDELMPAPVLFANQVLEQLDFLRKSEPHPTIHLGPDAKCQVTLDYEHGTPVRLNTLVISHQHLNDVSPDDLEAYFREVVLDIFPETIDTSDARWLVNPTGKFMVGGPNGDTGLTGRKIIVDTYGGAAPHGGGAFSGKDPTKVDRSAAYAARWIARNVVAAELAEECLIQLSYAIGVAEPTSIFVELPDGANVKAESLETFLLQELDLTPRGIRNSLHLNNPIYKKTASYGHFGRTAENGYFTWEENSLHSQLKSHFG